MIDIQAVKLKIINLALKGRMSRRFEGDGNANELLSQHGKKKASQGILCGQEVPLGIPENWAWVNVCDLGTFISGYTPASELLRAEGDLPYFKVSDMNKSENEYRLFFSELYINKENCKRTYPVNTIVYPKNGGALLTNKKRILAQESVVDLNTGGFIPFEGLTPELAYMMFQTIDFKHYAKGTSVPTLDMVNIKKICFPLPPLAEQKRIINAVQNAFCELDIIKDFQQKYLGNIMVLNQKVLGLAVRGKLVQQDDNDEPAWRLLDKILKEKQRLIKEKKVKKDKNISRIYKDGDSWYEEANNEITCIDEEIPYEIPENWSWARINELGDYKKGPFGSALTKSMFVPAGVDTVKVYEQKNAIQKDCTLGNYYITQQYYNERMKGFTVESGDVIVSCAGTIGETYIMPKDIELGIINQALMRMRIYEPMSVEYFLLYFDFVLKKTAKENSRGSAIKNIPPFAIFKRMLIPIPPLAEQHRIMKAVKNFQEQLNGIG